MIHFYCKESHAHPTQLKKRPPQRMAQAVESTGRVTVPHRLVATSGSYVAAIGHCGQRSEWRSLGLRIKGPCCIYKYMGWHPTHLCGDYSLIVNYLYFLFFFDVIFLVSLLCFYIWIFWILHFWFGGFTNVSTVGLLLGGLVVWDNPEIPKRQLEPNCYPVFLHLNFLFVHFGKQELCTIHLYIYIYTIYTPQN